MLDPIMEGVGARDTDCKGRVRVGEGICRPLDELRKIEEKREFDLVLRVNFSLRRNPLRECHKHVP